MKIAYRLTETPDSSFNLLVKDLPDTLKHSWFLNTFGIQISPMKFPQECCFDGHGEMMVIKDCSLDMRIYGSFS